MTTLSIKRYHFVYRITNIYTIPYTYYYGTHTTSKHKERTPKEELGVTYFSSKLDKSFEKDQKENPQNYKYKVVKIFNTRKEALELEIYLHKRFDVGVNENFYNGAIQTSTGFDVTGTKQSNKHINNRVLSFKKGNYTHSKKTKKLISNGNKGKILSNKTKDLISKQAKLQVHSKERKAKMSILMSGKNNPMFGIKNTLEMKKINSEKNSGAHNGATYVIQVFNKDNILIENINSYDFNNSIYPKNAFKKTLKYNSVIGDKCSVVRIDKLKWQGWYIRKLR